MAAVPLLRPSNADWRRREARCDKIGASRTEIALGAIWWIFTPTVRSPPIQVVVLDQENLYGCNGMQLDDFSIEGLAADGWLR